MTALLQFASRNQQYDARHLKVFIHGYMSATDEYDQAKLIKYIPDLSDSEDALFAFWDSGSMSQMWGDILQSAAKNISLSKIGVARGLVAAAISGAGHFNGKKDQAREVGQVFFAELKQFTGKYPNLQSISLYGHSLGGRVLVEALLAAPGETGFTIRNLSLMGAAREVTKEEVQHILPLVQQRIFNFYSASDKVLLAKPSLEKCAGRHPLHEPNGKQQGKVFNANLDIGHTDYWGILRTLFNYTRNEGARTVRPAGMQHPHVVDDLLLFPVLYCAESENLQLLSRILATKRSCSIPDDCIDAELIAHEIQLMGGNSIANKTRGNKGVSYAEVVEDVAKKLDVKTKIGQHTTIEKEELIYKKVLHALKSHAAVTGAEQGDAALLRQYFGSEQCATSINALNKILGDLTFDPAGPAFSVTIPLVAVVHFLRNSD